MISTILVVLDGSPSAPRVLDRAAEIADRFGAKLYLFRAVTISPNQPEPGARDAGGEDPLPPVLRRSAIEDLKRLAAGDPRASFAEILVEIGDSWVTFVTVANRIGADLVVMGGHLDHWHQRHLRAAAADRWGSGFDVLFVQERNALAARY